MDELNIKNDPISLPQDGKSTGEINEALKEMEMLSDDKSVVTEVSENQKDITLLDQQSANVKLAKSPLHIIEEICNDMAEFLDSLKEFEVKAGRVADMWFRNAETIASTNGNLNEKQQEEFFINVTLGVAATGIAKIFTTGLAALQLEKLKGLLKDQAKCKLEDLQKALRIQEEVCNNGLTQFLQASTYTDRQILFSEYRLALYYLDCTKYLIATYEAALENKFQNSVHYPSFYLIDCEIFYSQVTKTHRASSEEAILEAKIETIAKTAIEGAEALAENREPSTAAGLLGSDEAVTGMAVLDVMPAFSINEEGEVKSSLISHEKDEDEECPDILRKNSPLFKLMVLRECAEGKTDSFALAVKENEVLNSLIKHCMAIGATHRKYESIKTLHVINTLLFGVLFFCIAFIPLDFAWYWSLGSGVLGFIIARWMAPWTALKDKYNDKVTMICCCIQQEAKKASGYTEDILSKINAATKKRLWILILGGCIGLLGGPIGFLICLILGASIGGYFDGKEREVKVEDYETFSIGSKVKPIIMMCLLGILIICVILGGPIEW